MEGKKQFAYKDLDHNRNAKTGAQMAPVLAFC
jgi:hypothetical protein